ncbi:putative bifunctional diguanylate cyclase/phosphodiesterase [Pleionea mediterranea]|nr:EAL domain-containing protein [Pleionea mediterranea]
MGSLVMRDNQSSQYQQAITQALDSTRDLVLVCDKSGEILVANRIAREIFEIPVNHNPNITRCFKFIDHYTNEFIEPSLDKLLNAEYLESLEHQAFLVTPSGTEIAFNITMSELYQSKGDIMPEHFVIVVHDETQTYRLKQSVNFHRKHDLLTGVANRVEFEKQLMESLQDTRLNKGQHSLCMIKMEQIKLVNDSAGHLAVCELLKAYSDMLKQQIRANDLLARISNDEFALLLWQVDPIVAERVATKILASVRDFSFEWQQSEYLITTSIGIVEVNDAAESWAQLISCADLACLQAKQKGQNRCAIYSPITEDIKSHKTSVAWVGKIIKAVKSDQFELYQQPIYSLTDNTHLDHCELLLRMRDGKGGIINPGAFLMAAEKYDMINVIDRWVVMNSFVWLCENRDISLDHININLSGISLTQPEFLGYVHDLVEAYLVPVEKVCFEITETAAVENVKKAREFITSMRSLGCRIALDDFGTGMASFSYLKNLPVDFVKIDGEFVKEIHQDKISRSMVKSINDVAHEMELQTVAEYVENKEVAVVLRDMGIDFGQGYGLAVPSPINTIIESTAQSEYASDHSKLA